MADKPDLSGYGFDTEHTVQLSRADSRPEHKSEHGPVVNYAVGHDAGTSRYYAANAEPLDVGDRAVCYRKHINFNDSYHSF